MASKVEMKKKFLGILLHSTVKKLTEEKRNDEAPVKLSKNGGIGMKNRKLRGNIHKILGELAPKNESSSLEVNDIKQQVLNISFIPFILYLDCIFYPRESRDFPLFSFLYLN